MNDEMTLDEAMALFMVSRRARGCAPRTLLNYEVRLGAWRRAAAMRGVGRLAELTAERLDRWQAELHAGNGAAKSLRGQISAVKTFLNFCYQRRYLAQDAGAWLTLPYVDYQTTTRRRRMSREDFRRMLAVFEEQAARGHWRNLALFVFIADTGCRRSEAAALRWGEIDLARREAFVAGKMRRYGHRPVVFSARCAEVLTQWRAQWATLGVAHDAVFVNVDRYHVAFGAAMTPDAISQVFKRAAKKAGVTKNFGPQNLRHAVGHEYTMRANLEVARQKLGHSRVTTTARFYAGVEPEQVRQATDELTWLE